MTLQSTESQRLITADQWLAQAYPHRDRLHADIAGRLARRTPIPINAADKAFFGLIFEHALGLDLAVEPPYAYLFDCLTELQAHRLLALAGYNPPDADPAAAYQLWRKPTGPICPARLFTAAGSLSHLYQIVRVVAPATPESGRAVLHAPLHHRPLIRKCQCATWAARPAFRPYWASYISGFQGAIRSYGRVVVAPALLDARRHADLIAGATMLEVKTGRLDRPHYVNGLINQLLTYALLALRDGYPVTHVAAYLARYELLVRYPLQDVWTSLPAAGYTR